MSAPTDFSEPSLRNRIVAMNFLLRVRYQLGNHGAIYIASCRPALGIDVAIFIDVATWVNRLQIIEIYEHIEVRATFFVGNRAVRPIARLAAASNLSPASGVETTTHLRALLCVFMRLAAPRPKDTNEYRLGIDRVTGRSKRGGDLQVNTLCPLTVYIPSILHTAVHTVHIPGSQISPR
jgi:hypothetical protein